MALTYAAGSRRAPIVSVSGLLCAREKMSEDNEQFSSAGGTESNTFALVCANVFDYAVTGAIL